MEYQGVKLDIEQIISENASLRGQLHELELRISIANQRAQRAMSLQSNNSYLKDQLHELETQCSNLKKGWSASMRECSALKKELSALKNELPHINSEAGKIRMAAYNQAKQWNKSVSQKFDFMIAKSKKGNLFERLVLCRIWKMMKSRWDSDCKKIRKQY